ncbi:tetratricopeptide repeat protein [Aestuariirhabdus sp. Z084]|uniref:tetratricopeptide repeat protein n=1 Tax=Aestuariirhabdus haliotis TaxID=2918751 RepID=UPI00201B3CE2|nr:tetratricopeptide repeat protein [Aestuariirhabdus haliotis]MCL6415194.1 tetratricopeptide repeat protein [Aestuariirhabdus haliotis]MCL6420069.1 tetratricopeptide repeat protein [Aestuariirhabdus haliotis]
MTPCRLRAFNGLIAPLLLAGCVTTSIDTDNSAPATQAKNAPSTVQKAPEASFHKDTLYALMVAELAGNRERLDLSLGNYLEQAHNTRDPGVAERALRIAHYIGARQAALEAARIWAETDPDNRQALQTYALELAHVESLNEAADLMQRVLEMGGETHFDLLAARAESLPPRQLKALLSVIDTSAQRFPDNTQLMLARALLLEHEQQYDEALEQLQKLLDQEPESRNGLLHQSRILHRIGRDNEAAKELQGALKSHPQDQRLRLLYGRVLLGLGQTQQALAEFKTLHERSPNDSDLTLSIALTALEGEQPNEAENYLNLLLEQGERGDTAHYYLGRLAESRDDWQTARDHYLQVKSGNEFLPAYTHLSQLLADREQLPQAQKHLRQARDQRPELRIQLYLLESEVLIDEREYDEADKTLSEALKVYPRNISLLYARAMLAEKNDDLDKLEQDLRTILGIDPENAVALNALGYTLADRTTRYEEAAELIRKAMQLNPDDPAVIDSMGWVEFRLGNYDRALELLQQAYAMMPDHEISAHLVEVLWMQGRQQEALQLWEEALQQHPESELLKAVMERLNPS